MSRPAFLFYPADWLTDVGLRRCSAGARAAWMDMICLMHEGEPYGHLASKTGALPVKFVAQTCGVSVSKLAGFIVELEQNGVFSRAENATIFSRRMVKDERLRLLRSKNGAQSVNNPNVPKAKAAVAGEDILPPTTTTGSPSVSGSGNTLPTDKKEAPTNATIPQFPETAATIREYFPAATDRIVISVIGSSLRAYAEVTAGKRAPPLTDAVLSEAVHVAKFNGQTSAGGFKEVVPRCVQTWAEQAIKQGSIP